jgi:hypothetical protein
MTQLLGSIQTPDGVLLLDRDVPPLPGRHGGEDAGRRPTLIPVTRPRALRKPRHPQGQRAVMKHSKSLCGAGLALVVSIHSGHRPEDPGRAVAAGGARAVAPIVFWSCELVDPSGTG